MARHRASAAEALFREPPRAGMALPTDQGSLDFVARFASESRHCVQDDIRRYLLGAFGVSAVKSALSGRFNPVCDGELRTRAWLKVVP
jgi:hypothetical protein